MIIYTPDRWQSETLLTIDKRGSKTATNIVFDCHLLQVIMGSNQAFSGSL